MADFFDPDTVTGEPLMTGLNAHLANLSSYYAGQSDPRIENDSIRLWFDTTTVTRDIKGTQTQVQTLKFYGNDGWKDLFYIPVGSIDEVFVPGVDVDLTDVYTLSSSSIGASARALNNLYNNRSDSYNSNSSTTIATSKSLANIYDLRTHEFTNDRPDLIATGAALNKLFNNRSNDFQSYSEENPTIATSKAVSSLWDTRSSDTLTNSHDRLATTASTYAVLQRAQQSPIGVRNEDNIVSMYQWSATDYGYPTGVNLLGVELDLQEGIVVLHRSYFQTGPAGGRD